jgi:hypothetical protein
LIDLNAIKEYVQALTPHQQPVNVDDDVEVLRVDVEFVDGVYFAYAGDGSKTFLVQSNTAQDLVSGLIERYPENTIGLSDETAKSLMKEVVGDDNLPEKLV